MAYFIVIGTDNDVKCVVDEIKNAHLQHNVITSGCILSEGDELYYHWDVFNANGEKTKENRESIVLHDALTNQISQFKTLIPDDAVPNVFIVSMCFDEKESEHLQMVCDELYRIGGAELSGLQVDIILLGYDLNKPGDVTRRPHWRLLESIRGLGEVARFHTNILYINNMDYMGAATNVDARILSKFLCHWSKMICSSGFDPKSTVHSRVYAIGMSEHQYDFRDLNEFFKLSAEERLLERTLYNAPSLDTQELLDKNYYKKIDLDLPWLDGLCHIQSLWNLYCTTQWDSSKPISENGYFVAQQELKLASFLNLYLKLYISEEQREIETLNAEMAEKESEISKCNEKLRMLNELPEDDTTKATQDTVNDRIAQLESAIEHLKSQVGQHQNNIANNTFLDADAFYEKFGTMDLLTEDDEAAYATNKDKVQQLTDYVKCETGINIMREAVERATTQDVLPDTYPESEVLNMGRVEAIVVQQEPVVEPLIEVSSMDNQSERHGCLFWFSSLFSSRKSEAVKEDIMSLDSPQSDAPIVIDNETKKRLNENIGKCVVAIKKADEIRAWWSRLCDIIDKDQKRLTECKILMDGEKNANGGYVKGKEGYHPQDHMKSTSLIDMDRVRAFRDTNDYYKQNIDKFLDRWFDKTIEIKKRMTMPELIKHQVLNPLVGRFHTLLWDGNNPFVKEEMTDEELHEYIEYDLKQSKPFVEYVRIHESNLVSNVCSGFFSNNQNLPTDHTEFKNKYNISTESLNPVFQRDFVNSLCVIQIIDIPDHVDALKDFKPIRDAELSRLQTDIKTEVTKIIEAANTVEAKAKAIYEWLCDNIAYDTTKQIHDAETCYNMKRGVCQAYCELFCYMAEAAGLTADIITGITKDADGRISDEKHAWLYVYTHAYEGMLIDPTWGAGAVDGKRFVRSDDKSIWFNVSPYWMIFSHFPDKPYWSKLDIQISEEQFKGLPVVDILDEEELENLLFESITKTNKNLHL